MERIEMPKGFVVVVDPYMQHLVNRLRADGIKIIAVYSAYELDGAAERVYAVDNSLFEQVYRIDGDDALQQAVKALKNHEIVSVINGFDTGCALWVRLCNALDMPMPPPMRLESILGNKYRTASHLRELGVPCAKSILIDAAPTIDDIDSIGKKVGYPLIVKPTESAGSFGVHVCNDTAQASAAIALLLGKPDIFGNVMTELVMEELLVGREYSVCCVSQSGRHHITAVFSYDEYMIEGVKFARSVDLQDLDTPEVAEIVRYSLQILDAMGYLNGQAYIESILTQAGPRLVEFNPRIAGLSGALDTIANACTGSSQVELTSATCLNEATDELIETYRYKKRGHGKLLFLRNYRATTIASLSRLESIGSLESVRQMKIRVKPGDSVPPTTDVLSSPAYTIMHHSDEDQLRADIRAIESIEMEGMFH